MLNAYSLKYGQLLQRNLQNYLKQTIVLPTKPNCSRRALTVNLHYSSPYNTRVIQTIQHYHTIPLKNIPYKRWDCQTVRKFHTTSPKKIPAFFLLAMKSAGKVLAILSGRGFRKWWNNLPPNKKEYFLGEFKKSYKKIILISVISLGLLGVYYQTHIQDTPITKRKRFVALTSEQFNKVANYEYELQKSIYQDELLPITDPAYKRVGAVTQRLLTSNAHLQQVPNRTWSILIIDSPQQNAFVLPGGQIFVFSGMLDLCKSDDQLGIILAHELAHCILEHGVEQLSYSHLLDFAIIVVLAGIWALVPSDGIAIITQWFFHKIVSILLSLPYSRKLETEADEVGLQLAAKACLDVRESSAFWSKMAALDRLGQGTNIEWLSTHPGHQSRSTHLDTIIPQALELREKCGCPNLTKEDPREAVTIISRTIQDEMQRRKVEPQALLLNVPEK